MKNSVRSLLLGLMLSGSAVVPAALAAIHAQRASAFAVCDEAAPRPVCRIENPSVPVLQEGARAWLEGDLLYIAFRGKAREVQLAGELVPEVLPRIAEETWLRVLRIKDPSKVFLRPTLVVRMDDGTSRVEQLSVSGRDFVVQPQLGPKGTRRILTIASKFLPEARRVEVVFSPNYVPGAAAKTIYLADGVTRLADRLVEQAEALALPPFVIVGIAPCRTPPVPGKMPCRTQEYADYPHERGGDPERFLAHDRFLTEEVMPTIEREFGVSRMAADRAVAGASSGGDWAVRMAVRHPELFSYAVAMSPGLFPMNDTLPAGKPPARVSVAAGIFEPDFVRMATCWAGTLAEAGGSVTYSTHPYGHSPTMWEKVFFADAAAWLKGTLPPATQGLKRGASCGD